MNEQEIVNEIEKSIKNLSFNSKVDFVANVLDMLDELYDNLWNEDVDSFDEELDDEDLNTEEK